MAKRAKSTDDILIDLLIVQCATAGLTGHQIRDVVGVDMNRVSLIMKYFKKKKGRALMAKSQPSPTEEVVRLLQTLVARDMARSGVTQEDIGKHLHIAKAYVGPMVRGISKKADA